MKTKIDLDVNIYELEINGKTYPVAERSAETEEKISARDARLKTASEYDSNIELLETLLGKDAVKEIFPEGKSTNLDAIAKVAYYALKYYYHDKNEFESRIINGRLGVIKDATHAIKEAKAQLPS